MSGRRDFLSMPAPENYVAGLGRGATGFTTRSDLGPAREGPSEDQMKEMLAKRAAQLGAAAPSAYGVTEKKPEEDEEEDRFQDPDNEVGLFSSGMNYDKEDDEADRIYQEVDEKMDKRRRARRLVPLISYSPCPSPLSLSSKYSSRIIPRTDTDVRPREAREQQERDDYEKNNPKIQLQFADLKRALGGVSEEEWAALPEVGDMTGKAKRAREARMANARSYAVPDSVLNAAAKAGELDTSISSNDADSGTMTNFASIGQAQKDALQVRLDSAARAGGTDTQTNTSGTATAVDPKGYLTSLDRKQAAGDELPVEDINRARVLLESTVRSNVNNGPGYVALARLEEVAGKLHTAKKVIQRGCENCPRSQVVWEEAIRLNRENTHNAKIIAANAIKQLPHSVGLWKAAIDLEQTPAARKKVTRLALDHNAQSVELWKTLINDTEELENVRLLFAKATEQTPLSEELWISYARVCEPEHAQQVLNQARKSIPTSWLIWVAACRLQEQLGKVELLDKIMQRAVKALIKENAMMKREEWLTQAEVCEEEGDKATAAAIVKATIGWGLDEDDDRRDVWLDDSKGVSGRGHYEVARAIISHCVSIFPYSTTVWHASADLEKHHGSIDTLLSVLERAVNACHSSESLWLMYAREMWNSGNVDGARQVLGRSFEQLPGNENLYTRAVDFEVDAGNMENARSFLATARASAATGKDLLR
jgi:pre-mRNA-processing factor 6